MNTVYQLDDIQDHLAYLRADSFTIMATFVSVIGYFWLLWVAWPTRSVTMPPAAWVGCIVLIGSAIGGQVIKSRSPQLLTIASSLLVGGTIIAIECLLLIFQSTSLFYLFIIPLIFASVLLSQRTVVWIAVLASILLLATQVSELALLDLLATLVIFLLVTIASLLSKRNLYTALAWTFNGYEEARQKAKVARERQAELKRVLKDLDTATYNLERTNYMLAIARDRAEEAGRLKQQFAQNISHELRTPLNLVVGFVETMIESPEYYGGQLPPSYLHDLSIVYRNAIHLQSLVEDVLDLARIEAAQMSIVPQETDITSLVEEAVNTARSLIERKGLRLHVEIAPNLPPLWIDPVRIRQVLFNLLNNAARFTEQGSVTVQVSQDQDNIVFVVTDTGVGIAPQDLPRIFDAFHQLDGSMERKHGGAGLGLTISQRFVQLHNGRIWVESEVGQGSTFCFSLPIRQVTTLDREDAVSDMKVASRLKQSPIVLIVTQSSMVAALFARHLQAGRTVIVHTLEQARHVARQVMPQSVIIDTAVSTWHHLDYDQLSESWGLEHTPFIACTLPGDSTNMMQSAGAAGYLIKPVTRQSLWDVLRQYEENIDRVLVVDDDHDFVQLMTRLLDHPLRRYEVFTAYNGRDTVAMTYHLKPDLILLDLNLPDMDGLEVIKQIRTLDQANSIPIVIVSGQDEMDEMAVFRGPVVVHKTAGFPPEELLSLVRMMLRATTHIALSSSPGAVSATPLTSAGPNEGLVNLQLTQPTRQSNLPR